MQYILLLSNDENVWETLSEADRNKGFAAYGAYTEALKNAGAYLGGAPLAHSADGARVRADGGTRRVEDGPFSDSKEQLGGFYLIEAGDLDSALDWAAKCPCAEHGTVEVRPVWQMG